MKNFSRWFARPVLPLCLSAIAALGPAEPAGAAAPPAKVQGRVFVDTNGNGMLDGGESGLAGVQVTDGIQIVTTDAQGKYEVTVADDPVLPLRATRTVSVSWPDNYWPSSRWWRRLADLPADGRLDFALRPDEQKLPISILHGTDPHNSMTGEFQRLCRDEVSRMGRGLKLAFITGDLGYAGEANVDADFTRVREYTEKFPVPMFHTIGNHDIVGGHSPEWNSTEIHGNGAFTKHLGPIRWSFTYAGVHFVALEWAGRNGLLLEHGALETTSLQWLEADLALLKKPARIYFFMHNGFDKTGRLFPLLARHKVEMFLAGQSHRNSDDVINGVPYLTTMNFSGQYKILNITEKNYQVIHRCLGCKNPGRRHRASNASYPNTGTCRVALPNLEPRREAHASLAGRDVDKAELPVGDVKSQRLEADIRIEPGSAKSWGLRIGPDSQGRSIELIATTNSLRCGDLTTDPAREPGEKNDHWHLALDEGGLSVWLNEHARFDVPYTASSPVAVTLLARDGSAKFTQVDVWELKPGESFRKYKEQKKYK